MKFCAICIVIVWLILTAAGLWVDSTDTNIYDGWATDTSPTPTSPTSQPITSNPTTMEPTEFPTLTVDEWNWEYCIITNVEITPCPLSDHELFEDKINEKLTMTPENCNVTLDIECDRIYFCSAYDSTISVGDLRSCRVGYVGGDCYRCD